MFEDECEMRDGKTIIEQIQSWPMESPPRWQEFGISSPEAFYLPPTPPITTNTSTHDIPYSISSRALETARSPFVREQAAIFSMHLSEMRIQDIKAVKRTLILSTQKRAAKLDILLISSSCRDIKALKDALGNFSPSQTRVTTDTSTHDFPFSFSVSLKAGAVEIDMLLSKFRMLCREIKAFKDVFGNFSPSQTRVTTDMSTHDFPFSFSLSLKAGAAEIDKLLSEFRILCKKIKAVKDVFGNFSPSQTRVTIDTSIHDFPFSFSSSLKVVVAKLDMLLSKFQMLCWEIEAAEDAVEDVFGKFSPSQTRVTTEAGAAELDKLLFHLRFLTFSKLELISSTPLVPTQRIRIVQERITPPFQRLQEFPAEHDLSKSKTMRGSTLQDLKFVEASDPCMDVSDLCLTTLQCIHKEPAIPLNRFISDHAESGNRMRVNISNQELLQQQTPVSASDLTGSSTCNESEGDFIPRRTFPMQELPSSAAGSTHGGLMPSENVGISLNNLTTSAAEAFPDHSSAFTTSETFKSRDALESWYRKVGRSNAFEVVVGRSDSGLRAKNARITLVCERSGPYKGKGKNTELHQDKKLTTIATKKCKCPFKLKCQMSNGGWTVQVICGKHNHQCSPGFENLELQGKKIPASCNIPSIGRQDEAGRQMFDSSLTTNEGDFREKNRFHPNFGEGSSRLRTVNASNVESRETPTSQTSGGMLTFSDPAWNQVMATLPHIVPHSTATQYERITGVTATYGKVKVKLPLSSLSGIVQLEEQVAKRLRLELGSFKVEYQEDEQLFLIACDEALQECVEFSSSLRNGQISLLVTI